MGLSGADGAPSTQCLAFCLLTSPRPIWLFPAIEILYHPLNKEPLCPVPILPDAGRAWSLQSACAGPPSPSSLFPNNSSQVPPRAGGGTAGGAQEALGFEALLENGWVPNLKRGGLRVNLGKEDGWGWEWGCRARPRSRGPRGAHLPKQPPVCPPPRRVHGHWEQLCSWKTSSPRTGLSDSGAGEVWPRSGGCTGWDSA